jgi:hypothetical protein
MINCPVVIKQYSTQTSSLINYQGVFYDRSDAVVLLSAPREVDGGSIDMGDDRPSVSQQHCPNACVQGELPARLDTPPMVSWVRVGGTPGRTLAAGRDRYKGRL